MSDAPCAGCVESVPNLCTAAGMTRGNAAQPVRQDLGTAAATLGTEAEELLAITTFSQPGVRRFAIDVRVPAFGAVVRDIEQAGGRPEHFYDYQMHQ